MIRVAAVDDDRMLLDGLATWVRSVPDLRLVATAATVDELLRDLAGPVDVVLLDLVLRDRSAAAENVGRLVSAGHRVLVLSVWARPDQVVATFEAGASGYVTKDHDLAALAAAVREVYAERPVFSTELAFACLGDTRPVRPQLSPRERAVLLAYASGMTLKAAARHLGIKPETARTYLDRVKVKYHDLGRPSRTKLELAERVREDQLR
ncbi:response regulator [Micromonospora echinofusca]|uniref:Response regulator n=1 Tax=Micromonospora echinofusca TaxID=47858 RepID=A0ABS3VKB1_MICEH|nr:response regulator [Micromonospora echinofusca]